MRDHFDAEPFKIAVPEAVLIDLKQRLAATRWPIEAKARPWRYGTDKSWLHQVVEHWRDRYDWRHWERQLNRFPHWKADVGGRKVHFILERGSGPNPMPLIITHGWPGSIVEFMDIIEPLAHPERFGGDVADAFTVIAPSLPGYGFSDPPEAPITPRDIGHLWHELMTEVLGCDRYVVAGRRLGRLVTSWLALDHPERIAALHLNIAGAGAASRARRPGIHARGTGLAGQTARPTTRPRPAYQQIQGTKPQTLSYGLTNSPAGLAAWILEKFHGWTTPGAETPPPFDLDHLLDQCDALLAEWHQRLDLALCVAGRRHWHPSGRRREGPCADGPLPVSRRSAAPAARSLDPPLLFGCRPSPRRRQRRPFRGHGEWAADGRGYARLLPRLSRLTAAAGY